MSNFFHAPFDPTQYQRRVYRQTIRAGAAQSSAIEQYENLMAGGVFETPPPDAHVYRKRTFAPLPLFANKAYSPHSKIYNALAAGGVYDVTPQDGWLTFHPYARQLSVSYSLTPSDSVVATDSGIVLGYSTVLSDTSTVTDGYAIDYTLGTFADTVTITDSDTETLAGITLTPTDSVTATDSVLTAMNFQLTLSDSTSSADVQAFDFTKVLTDTESITDSAATAVAFNTSLVDSFTTADTLTFQANWNSTFTDSVVAIDVAVPVRTIAPVALADTTTITDVPNQYLPVTKSTIFTYSPSAKLAMVVKAGAVATISLAYKAAKLETPSVAVATYNPGRIALAANQDTRLTPTDTVTMADGVVTRLN